MTQYRTAREVDQATGASRRSVSVTAALLGMITAVGALVLLTALLAVIAIPLELNLIDPDGALVENVEWVGIVIASIVVFVAFMIGGWASARTARRGGVGNGLMVGLWLIIMIGISALIGAAFGVEYNFLVQASLPDWFTQMTGDVTTLATVATLLGVGAALAGALLGGVAGEAANRRDVELDIEHAQKLADQHI